MFGSYGVYRIKIMRNLLLFLVIVYGIDGWAMESSSSMSPDPNQICVKVGYKVYTIDRSVASLSITLRDKIKKNTNDIRLLIAADDFDRLIDHISWISHVHSKSNIQNIIDMDPVERMRKAEEACAQANNKPGEKPIDAREKLQSLIHILHGAQYLNFPELRVLYQDRIIGLCKQEDLLMCDDELPESLQKDAPNNWVVQLSSAYKEELYTKMNRSMVWIDFPASHQDTTNLNVSVNDKNIEKPDDLIGLTIIAVSPDQQKAIYVNDQNKYYLRVKGSDQKITKYQIRNSLKKAVFSDSSATAAILIEGEQQGSSRGIINKPCIVKIIKNININPTIIASKQYDNDIIDFLSVSPDESRLIVAYKRGAQNNIDILNINTAIVEQTLLFDNVSAISALSFSADGQWFEVSCSDAVLKVYKQLKSETFDQELYARLIKWCSKNKRDISEKSRSWVESVLASYRARMSDEIVSVKK